MKLFLRGLLIFTVLTLVWQAAVMTSHIPDYLLPSPWQIWITLCQSYPLILSQAWPTLLETLLGFSLGILFGCLAGLMITFFRPLRAWFWPLLIVSQAVPTFAIAPLLVIWLGYGLASKVATTVLMVFFPVASALHDGLRHTESGWLDLAATMNARPWRVFWHIRLPAALPALASGIRIAAVAAPVGAIIGEWVGASSGLGYLMINANARMQIDMMFAALTGIMVLALSLYYLVDRLLRALIAWDTPPA
ncbi:Putative aliphatic sulfonates transport permease protein SsuC [Aquicella siphonis]|uniref:Aliphatic sulfonates transport permease protein SsuC n=1 Tax=Aquicella siphonis TaxID=254247 RepID=A0A5E4PIL5_9COXI|nr:ABC transporter permease [Aquicella siphonis]VVC76222.1 Putative aliphatic sulfonates transport permease protein SsuC [Aquicella siphonis]